MSAKTEVQVRTFNHVRKGPLRGIVVWESEDGEWFDVQLVGDHNVRYVSIEGRLNGATEDGEIVRCRKSLTHETTQEASDGDEG